MDPFTLFGIFIVSLIAGLIILVIVLLVILLERGLIGLDQLDQRVFRIPERVNREEVFKNLVDILKRQGYDIYRVNNKCVLNMDYVVKINLELDSKENIIKYHVAINKWFLIIMIVLLLTPLTWLVIVLGIILYFRYDSVKRTIFSTIHSIIHSLPATR
ncbi:MAG: hypothetical protein ABWW65_02490 [Thermoprotei archaeon]